MACLEELPGQRLQEKKPTNKVFYHSLGLQSCIWKKTTTKLLQQYILDRWDQSWNVRKNQTKCISTNSSNQLSVKVVEGGCFLVCDAAGDLTIIESTTNSSVYQSILEVKCEAICPIAKTWPKLGHATLQWSQAQVQ